MVQAISASVGENGSNVAADAALVQVLLMKATRPAGQAGPYLASYDGVCGPATKAAIKAFQVEQGLVPAAGAAPTPNPAVTSGLVQPGDATWPRLVSLVPAAFADLRVLPSGSTVYLAASAADMQARVAAVSGLTFAPTFAIKVQNCIREMHRLHGIALGVCAQGDRRSFQQQYNLFLDPRGVTQAGPGESNHNYGMATDIGFDGLRWLHADGTPDVRETSWLHHLTAQRAAQATVFWDALRAVGTGAAVGAFRGPVGDRPHLQNWSDAGVSMGARLAALLQAVGTMQWSYQRPHYHCDLGLGGAQVDVGTAAAIWDLRATLTVQTLTSLRQAAAAAQRQPAPPTTAQDVRAMQQALRQQFDLADSNWSQWTPR